MSNKEDAVPTLDQLMANPDQLPTDMAALAALLGGADDALVDAEEGAEEEAAEQSEEGVPDDQSEPEAKAAEVPAKEDTPAVGEQDAPITSKDGKHTIPYSVLKNERDRRQAAEQAIKDLQDQLARQTSAAKTGDVQQTEFEGDASDEDMTRMAEEFPVVGKLLKQVQAQQKRLDDIAAAEAQRQADEGAKQRAEAQEAIDRIPKLLYLQQQMQAQDPVATQIWNAAVQADATLQKTPSGSRLSLDERFAKAIRIAEELHGEVALPADFQGSDAPDTSGLGAADPAPQNAPPRTKPAPVVAPQSKALRTLSNLPPGRPPSSDPLEDMANLPAVDLAAKFANMTVEQINQVLARSA